MTEYEKRIAQLYIRDVTTLTLDELKRDSLQLNFILSGILDRVHISNATQTHYNTTQDRLIVVNDRIRFLMGMIPSDDPSYNGG